MGSVQVSTEDAGNKRSLEMNFHTTRSRQNGVKNGHVVGEGQGLSEEEESRVNEVSEDMNDGCGGMNQSLQAGLQQQHLGPIVRWERFLPLRSLKVLLVEDDDSTRQVVSALLRNCSYEVTTAANGLQAWKILEDLTNHIDLILTEVVMPCLSGFRLLCKIMSHKTCKNIPVIMMSSHDSMGIVFKCLSKGAVDFLVKPIRKNELKNLWQHVWRRCHSSSGSGSESGIQTQKSATSKSVDETENNTSSNDENGNGSVGVNVGDGSDNGSGTQSSWTKRAVEVDSPQPMSPWDQQADPYDSTCAQVIHPKPETLCNEWVPMTVTTECEERKEPRSDDVKMGKDLEIGVSTNPDIQLDSYPKEKVSMIVTGRKKDKLPKQLPTKDIQSNGGLQELNSNMPFSKLRAQAANLIGVTDSPNCFSMISEISDKATADPGELPSLELSLKRLRSAGDGGIVNHNDRNVLRHSDLSAFSRYNTATAAAQATGYGESCSLPLDNGLDVMKTESLYNIQSNSNAAPLNQQSNGSSNNNDMSSTAKTTFAKPAAMKEKSVSMSAAKCVHPSSAFQPVQQCRTCLSQQVMPKKVDGAPTTTLGQPSGAHHQVQVQHHHQHYHHHHPHVHCMQQQLPPDPDDLSLKNMAAVAPQCGSSNVFGGNMEGNAGNYSLNGSVSGSNHGSNGQNGSSTAVNAGGINMESDNGLAGKSGAGGESGCGSGVDQNRFAQREAALTKFRQKRKERCFEKKVRYQSRKRLAEQRPRVRGQFVRQIVYKHTSQDNNC